MFCQFSTVQQSDLVTNTHTHIHSFSQIILHHALSQVTRYSSQCYTAGSLCLSIHSKCNSLHLLTPDSQSISLPPPPPWQPQVCSLNPWVKFLFCLFVSLLHVTFPSIPAVTLHPTSSTLPLHSRSWVNICWIDRRHSSCLTSLWIWVLNVLPEWWSQSDSGAMENVPFYF